MSADARRGHYERPQRCPACRKPYRTEVGYQRHVATHADAEGRPVCNCLLPVDLICYSHQLACPVSWMAEVTR